MKILAIDPGPERSAWLFMHGRLIVSFGIEDNDTVRQYVRGWNGTETVVIEQIASYGMAVGAEVFATVHWSGRFHEAAAAEGRRVVLLPRLAVKQHLCHDSRAKDANIRQALIDRFGGAAAKGTKARPGPLYGIANDVWSALALAVTYADREAAA
jgi:hypothetical protein